ncbi:MAG: hypothetical protein GWQ08_01215 [Verrucomicrobiaceae bacterium]|nr:hypothetical protein [Verrucomicrobiaceae bacterium]
MADPISCSITPWYTKRMSLMTLMFVGFGLYFLYDGFIGYPKKNAIYDEHVKFMEIQDEKAAFLEEGNTSSDWAKVVVEKGYPKQDDWIDYAADNGWPEEPPEKRYSTTDQFFFGALCCGIGLAILGTMMLNRGKVLRADGLSFTSPKGERVLFSSAHRIDKRKWDNKGLAYVHYWDEKEKERRAVIDDLKFGGADKILDRLLENFEGELVERVSTEAPSESTPESEDSETA